MSNNCESHLRRVATMQGLVLRKSRTRTISADNLGGYQLVDGSGNFIVAGARFELDLDGVAAALTT